MTPAARHAPRSEAVLFWLVALAWALIFLWPACVEYARLMAQATPRFLLRLQDPDIWLRLHSVRHWRLPDTGFFDHTLPRTQAPLAATVTPWTRPMDLLLAGMAGLFSQSTPGDSLTAAAIWVPPLLGLLGWWGMLCLLRLARPESGPLGALLLGLFVLTLKPLPALFLPGNADHHGLQLVIGVWMQVALLSRNRWRDAQTGLLLAAACWVSPEGLLPVALVVGWLGFDSLRNPESAARLARLSIALLLGSVLALAWERPPGSWPTFWALDTLSLTHVVLFIILAVHGGWWHTWRRGRAVEIDGAAVMAAGVALSALLAVWIAIPRFFDGPMGDIPPDALQPFLAQIQEAQPVWRLSFGQGYAALAASILAVFLLAVSRSLPLRVRHWLLFSQVCWLLATAGLVRLHIHSLAPLVIVLCLPPWIERLAAGPGMQALSPAVRRSVSWLGAVVLLLSLATLPQRWGRSPYSETLAPGASCEKGILDAARSGALAAAAPAAMPEGAAPLVLAPKNSGTVILFFTPWRIVASNYHREAVALSWMDRTYAEADETSLYARLRGRRIDYLLACPETLAPKSILARVVAGEMSPVWLQPVEMGAGSVENSRGAFRLYRVWR